MMLVEMLRDTFASKAMRSPFERPCGQLRSCIIGSPLQVGSSITLLQCSLALMEPSREKFLRRDRQADTLSVFGSAHHQPALHSVFSMTFPHWKQYRVLLQKRQLYLKLLCLYYRKTDFNRGESSSCHVWLRRDRENKYCVTCHL